MMRKKISVITMLLLCVISFSACSKQSKDFTEFDGINSVSYQVNNRMKFNYTFETDYYNNQYYQYVDVDFLNIDIKNIKGIDNLQEYDIGSKDNQYWCVRKDFEFNNQNMELINDEDIFEEVRLQIDNINCILTELGISDISENYDVMWNGSIYFVQLHQKIDDTTILEDNHGNLRKGSNIYGTYIDIYFDTDKILYLCITNLYDLSQANKINVELIKFSFILNNLSNTYAKVNINDVISVSKAEIIYYVRMSAPESYEIIPAWRIGLYSTNTGNKLTDVYYDAVTGKELI